MFRDPGKAMVIDRSLPRTVCHFLVLVCLYERGMLSKICHSLSMRSGGRWMVRFTVSTTQPKTVFTMFQLQSPFWSFFKETGSLWNDESSGPRGLNTWSIVCRSVLRTLRRFGSCAPLTTCSGP